MIASDAVEDQRPEPAGVHIGGDDCHTDDRHCRDAQSCDDDRQRERQLDAGENLRRAHSHAARRVDDLGGHVAYADCHVADQNEQRERDHGDDRVGSSEPHHRDQECQERERGDRVQKPRHGERCGVETFVACGDDTDGERQHKRDRKRRQRDRHVLPQRDGDLIPIAQKPAHGALKSPARTRASIRSMSGPRGRSTSSAGIAARTRS